MLTPRRRCLTRLVATATLLALGAAFACRPAWHQDGHRILFLARAGEERLAIALHDRRDDTTRVLFTAPSEAMATPLWDSTGAHAVVLWASKGDQGMVTATTLDPTTAATVRTLELPLDDGAEAAFYMAPVAIGSRLFFGDKGVRRVDLRSGETQHERGARGEELVLVPFGAGVGWFVADSKDEQRWQFGELDPETLARKVLLTPPADCAWQPLPMPAVSPDTKAIVFPARERTRDGATALLVFAEGRLERTIPLGNRREVDCGSLQWLPDGSGLVAGLARRGKDGEVAWSLFETTRTGGATRETVVVRGTPPKDSRVPAAAAFPFVLSPDGRTAAASTAMLAGVADEQHGLWLVDLASPRRTVSRVAFPAPPAERR